MVKFRIITTRDKDSKSRQAAAAVGCPESEKIADKADDVKSGDDKTGDSLVVGIDKNAGGGKSSDQEAGGQNVRKTEEVDEYTDRDRGRGNNDQNRLPRPLFRSKKQELAGPSHRRPYELRQNRRQSKNIEKDETSKVVKTAATAPCKICRRTFQSRLALQVHMRTHKSVRYTCIRCQRGYPSKKGLFDHLLREHKVDRTQAVVLAERAEIKEDPVRPSTVSEEKPHPCSYCHRSYRSRQRLSDHLKSHTSKSTKCEVCHRVYASRQGLKRHKWIHKVRSRLPCHLCPYSCLSKQTFRKHLVVAHKIKVSDSYKIATQQRKKQRKVSTDSEESITEIRVEQLQEDKKATPKKQMHTSKNTGNGDLPQRIQPPRYRSDSEIPGTSRSVPAIPIPRISSDPVTVETNVRDERSASAGDNASANETGKVKLNNNEAEASGSDHSAESESSGEIQCAICLRSFSSTAKLGRHICSIIQRLRQKPKVKKTNINPSTEEPTNNQKNLGARPKTCPRKLTRSSPTSSMSQEAEDAAPASSSESPKVSKIPFEGRPKILRFKCAKCGIAFPRSTTLAIHTLRAHAGKISRLCCTLCGRKFWKSSALESHLGTSHKVKPKLIKKVAQDAAATVRNGQTSRKRKLSVSSKKSEATPSARPNYPKSQTEPPSTDEPNSAQSDYRSIPDGPQRRPDPPLEFVGATHRCDCSAANRCHGGSLDRELVNCVSNITKAVQMIPTLLTGGLQPFQNSNAVRNMLTYHQPSHHETENDSSNRRRIRGHRAEEVIKEEPPVVDLTADRESNFGDSFAGNNRVPNPLHHHCGTCSCDRSFCN